MKYIVIGAGISGLSIAQLLNKDNEVTVLEKDERPGGMMKCDNINGALFHTTGGHVFNTKRQDVADFFWSFFNRDLEFLKAKRNASINFNKEQIPYPIENFLYYLSDEIGLKIIDELLKLDNSKKSKNFEEFLINRFGETLFQIYFKPYNEKIWKCDLKNVPLTWLDGKLPMPAVGEILYNNIFKKEEDKFVHSSFYYPLKNGSQFIIDRFSESLEIRYGHDVRVIEKKGDKWIVDGIEADRIIYCINIKELPRLLKNKEIIEKFGNSIEALKFHGTTSVFCTLSPNQYSWIYLPDKDYDAHRIICTGNFSTNNNGKYALTGTVEFTDEVSTDDIIAQLEDIPFSPSYLTHHYQKYTYPIQDFKTKGLIEDLKKELQPEGMFLCGRFAEWEYSNMDVCMGSAIDLYNNIIRQKI